MALFALACVGFLVIGISRDWIHVEYTVPQEIQTASAAAGTDVEVGKDGKLKLFDSASKLFSIDLSRENNPFFGCNSH